MNARPLDYRSRLIVDSMSIKCLRCVIRKIDFLFLTIEQYRLRCGSKLYSVVVDRTRMRTLYAPESLVEAY